MQITTARRAGINSSFAQYAPPVNRHPSPRASNWIQYRHCPVSAEKSKGSVQSPFASQHVRSEFVPARFAQRDIRKEPLSERTAQAVVRRVHLKYWEQEKALKYVSRERTVPRVMSPETGSKLPHSVFTYKPAVPCMGPQVLILKSSVLFTSAMDFRYSFLFTLPLHCLHHQGQRTYPRSFH